MSDFCNHNNYDDYFERCEDCGATREQIMTELVELVGQVEGVMTAPALANGGVDRENAMHFNQYYGASFVCELGDENCSEDGVLWGVGDFGSPLFCTTHYFPQEQLGYELIAESEKL